MDPAASIDQLRRRIAGALERLQHAVDPSCETETADPDVAYTVPAHVTQILHQCRPHTMTGDARLIGLIDAVDYVVEASVPGAFVECGVWRGGSVLAMILTLQHQATTPREIWLYDTFAGMTEPTEHDSSSVHEHALDGWRRGVDAGERPWPEMFGEHVFGVDQVRDLIDGTGYDMDRVEVVAGDVLETLPGRVPDEIALLRLDTDWYESTRHELEHLEPRLVPGGVLIIDDYGHWDGCRRAVDEYFANRPVLWSRLDYTGRMTVKPATKTVARQSRNDR
jgi:O-methyltransferase